MLNFPGSNLYADDLKAVLKSMKEKKMFDIVSNIFFFFWGGDTVYNIVLLGTRSLLTDCLRGHRFMVRN